MKKSEIQESINSIIDVLKTARDNIEEILEPYEDVKENLEEIQQIEFDYDIETGIDFEAALNDTIRSCVETSGDIEAMHDAFGEFYDKLSEWQETVGEEEYNKIEELYINPLADVKEIFDIDSIEEADDLDTQLFDMINALEEIEVE